MKIRNKTRIIILIISFILATWCNSSFSELLGPSVYFFPKGANEFFIELLTENNIPHEIEYGRDGKIKLIKWSEKVNRLALEQAFKVNQKIGATNTPESIKMLSPEMNDRLEKLLDKNNIPYERKGDFTFYEWKYWVEVELLKRKIWKKELEN